MDIASIPWILALEPGRPRDVGGLEDLGRTGGEVLLLGGAAAYEARRALAAGRGSMDGMPRVKNEPLATTRPWIASMVALPVQRAAPASSVPNAWAENCAAVMVVECRIWSAMVSTLWIASCILIVFLLGRMVLRTGRVYS